MHPSASARLPSELSVISGKRLSPDRRSTSEMLRWPSADEMHVITVRKRRQPQIHAPP